jgi:hypothetical protein
MLAPVKAPHVSLLDAIAKSLAESGTEATVKELLAAPRLDLPALGCPTGAGLRQPSPAEGFVRALRGFRSTEQDRSLAGHVGRAARAFEHTAGPDSGAALVAITTLEQARKALVGSPLEGLLSADHLAKLVSYWRPTATADAATAAMRLTGNGCSGIPGAAYAEKNFLGALDAIALGARGTRAAVQLALSRQALGEAIRDGHADPDKLRDVIEHLLLAEGDRLQFDSLDLMTLRCCREQTQQLLAFSETYPGEPLVGGDLRAARARLV